MFNKTKKSIGLDSGFVDLESTGFSATLSSTIVLVIHQNSSCCELLFGQQIHRSFSLCCLECPCLLVRYSSSATSVALFGTIVNYIQYQILKPYSGSFVSSEDIA